MEKADLNVFKSLNKHKVKYILIGGMAAILYGSPRITKDTDIFIEPTIENCQRLLSGLKSVNFGTADLTTAEKILRNEINIFKDYVHLDVFIKVKGITFQEVWANKVTKRIAGIPVPVIAIQDLIASKKAAAREIDTNDVKILKKVIAIKKEEGR